MSKSRLCPSPHRNAANIMWRKLLYSGFHTPKAVAYHEPTVLWLFMIGHSLGRMETCFGLSAQSAGIRCQNTSQIQMLCHFGLSKEKEKQGENYKSNGATSGFECENGVPPFVSMARRADGSPLSPTSNACPSVTPPTCGGDTCDYIEINCQCISLKETILP